MSRFQQTNMKLMDGYSRPKFNISGTTKLKKSKVLVLDEATTSVDTATNNLIQQTLRQHFSDCTVIAIAHRIASVIDSDMVLLFNQGEIGCCIIL